jgi:hypothetical protein
VPLQGELCHTTPERVLSGLILWVSGAVGAGSQDPNLRMCVHACVYTCVYARVYFPARALGWLLLQAAAESLLRWRPELFCLLFVNFLGAALPVTHVTLVVRPRFVVPF